MQTDFVEKKQTNLAKGGLAGFVQRSISAVKVTLGQQYDWSARSHSVSKKLSLATNRSRKIDAENIYPHLSIVFFFFFNLGVLENC